jgi:hypothetical protein
MTATDTDLTTGAPGITLDRAGDIVDNWNGGFASTTPSLDLTVDFRATSGFVSDPSGATFLLDEQYPIARAGQTFGWLSATGANSRDRNATIDARLAGINFRSTLGTFQLDLPSAGTYIVRVAMGDDAIQALGSQITIRDGSTTLLTLGPNDLSAATFMDAAGKQWSDSIWPVTNIAMPVTFAGTTFSLDLQSATSNGVIASVQIAGPIPAPPTPPAGLGGWGRPEVDWSYYGAPS